MTTFNKQDLQYLATLSALKVNDFEAEILLPQIKAILEYAAQLQAVTITHVAESTHNNNILRDDVIIKSDSSLLLKQAPEEDGSFFVVPKILNEK